MTFSPSTTVAELATSAPATIAVFQKHGIDFCCGGKRPLETICAERGIPYDALAGELRSATAPATPARFTWDSRPLRELTSHIVESFHDPLSVEMPRLVAMARRVEERHGAGSQPNAGAIAATLTSFAAVMALHTYREEQTVFPLIDRLDAGTATPDDALKFLHAETALEQEHQEAGRALATLRTLTHDHRAPEGACPTTLGLYYGLGELESLMTLHVHLENNVLFPRARALAESIR